MEMYTHVVNHGRCYQIEVSCNNFAKFTDEIEKRDLNFGQLKTGKCPTKYSELDHTHHAKRFTLEMRSQKHHGAAEPTLSLI